MNIHQWKGNIKRFNDEFSKHETIHKQWEDNTLENLDRLNKENSIWNLEFKYYQETEKAMLLVGASPILKDDVLKLKGLSNNFCIVCANSSLKFLLKNDVVPDYCICLDSDDIDIPQHLDVDTDKVTLLASSAVSGRALDMWKGPLYFMPYYAVSPNLRKRVRRRLGPNVPGGGNSITQAFYVASVIFGSKTIVFVANEYCFDSKKDYYADKNAAKQEALKILYPAVDVLGRKRWTLPAHYNYVIWQEKICDDLSPPGFFIDTSFGLLGKDSRSIHLMELSEAIGCVDEAFKNRNRLNNAKTDTQREKILEEISPYAENSGVYRYNMHEQREKLLQLART